MAETIRYKVADAIATITIDRPETRNALGPADWRALREAVARAGDDDHVRVVAVTGAGGTFCAGGDMGTVGERLAAPAARRRHRLANDARVIRDLRELPKPVVAVIEGHAVGAGLNLALACDLRISSSLGRFAASFHKVGFTSDFGGVYLLPQLVGVSKAIELLLLGELIEAAEALRIGLVHRVYPDEEFAGRADEFLAHIAELPTLAVALTKHGVYRAERMDIDAALEYEAASQALIGKSEDAAEGVRAFLQKRPPRFK